jgi:DtxR family Mn-dependent transcriptional regulator
MLKRLADEGVVEYEPYHGARLTSDGERIALEMIRHHRLLELFLAEVLGMPWDRVHAEAEVLEHHISDELEELIAAKLGEPALDPHGDPIPDRALAISDDDSVALTELDAGERAVFTRVSDSDASMLRYLSEHAIQPGADLEVYSREPFGGPVVIEAGGRTHPLGPELARSMRVRRQAGGE